MEWVDYLFHHRDTSGYTEKMSIESNKVKLTRKEIAARYHAKHRDEINRKYREKYAANPDKFKAASKAKIARERERDPEAGSRRSRKSRLTANGITAERYADLLRVQQATCAICRKVCPTGKRLAVDHDHQTGFIRGLLCTRCNMGIGQFQNNYQLLQKAATYMIIAVGNQALKAQGILGELAA